MLFAHHATRRLDWKRFALLVSVLSPVITGAIAQLGERLPCTQEVSGSIPLSSTNYFELKKPRIIDIRNKFIQLSELVSGFNNRIVL